MDVSPIIESLNDAQREAVCASADPLLVLAGAGSGKTRVLVHRVIYDELVFGKILKESRDTFVDIISDLAARGAQGVILGCTEIPLLVGQENAAVPVFDTTQIHAEEAVSWALNSTS